MNLHRMNRLSWILKTALVVSNCVRGVFIVLQHIHSINSLSFIVTTILSKTQN